MLLYITLKFQKMKYLVFCLILYAGTTVSQWLNIWEKDFLGNVKQGTADNTAMNE